MRTSVLLDSTRRRGLAFLTTNQFDCHRFLTETVFFCKARFVVRTSVLLDSTRRRGLAFLTTNQFDCPRFLTETVFLCKARFVVRTSVLLNSTRIRGLAFLTTNLFYSCRFVTETVCFAAVSASPEINRTELIASKLHPTGETAYSANMLHRLPIRLRCSNLPNF